MSRNIKEHILDTASKLFYSQGISATGIDAIVKTSGVAKMSLYKYFPSKEALVLAHLEKSAASLRDRILHGLEAKGDEPKQKLLSVFEVFEEILACPGFRGCPFINAAAEFADPASPVQQFSAEFYRSVTGLLADLARQARMANPEILARQLVVLLMGAIVREQVQHQSGSMQTAREVAEILIEKN